MIKSGFFNSVDGDRLYNADDISRMFVGVLSDGVYRTVGQACKVEPLNGMTLKVGTGRAVVSDRWAEIATVESVTLTAASTANPRYSAVVLRLDRSARTITLATKDGSAASTPIKPTITRNSDVYEICLAYIYVAANATTITAANIIDARNNPDVCGYVRTLTSQQIQRKEAEVVTASAGAVVAIPSSLDYQSGDIIDVFISGLKISPDDYAIDIDAGTITFDYSLDAGASVQIMATQSVSLSVTDIDEIIDDINGEVI